MMTKEKLKLIGTIFQVVGTGCSLASGFCTSKVTSMTITEETQKTVMKVMSTEDFRQKLLEQMNKKDS